METFKGIKWVLQFIGGSKGGARDAAPPPGSKFFHFHAVFGKYLKNNSTFGSWRTPWGKSWIRHCNLQGILFYIDLWQFESLFWGRQIALHVKNIPSVIILTTEGLIHYFYRLTLVQSHNFVMSIFTVSGTLHQFAVVVYYTNSPFLGGVNKKSTPQGGYTPRQGGGGGEGCIAPQGVDFLFTQTRNGELVILYRF